METIGQIVEWITQGGGAVIIVAWVASWLLEDFEWWHGIEAKFKKLIILAFSVVVAIAGQWMALHPDAYAVIEPYLSVVVLTGGVWLTTQVAHKADQG